MKKIMLASVAALVIITQLYAAVGTIIINNESTIDITVLIEYEDGSAGTYSLSPGEEKPLYAEDKCIYGVSIYSERWKTVADLESEDKLVIPKSWNRCQSWNFTIKKRSDGTVHVANKKIIT